MDALVNGLCPAGYPPIDVLLADRDVAVCDSMRALFESMGYTVHTVQDAAALETELRQAPPRCLVLAAELGGVELLAQLRAQGLSVPAIITSAQGGIPLAVAAMRAGALNFLEKPLLDARLLQTVRTALRR